jgi:hypothetical protein
METIEGFVRGNVFDEPSGIVLSSPFSGKYYTEE